MLPRRAPRLRGLCGHRTMVGVSRSTERSTRRRSGLGWCSTPTGTPRRTGTASWTPPCLHARASTSASSARAASAPCSARRCGAPATGSTAASGVSDASRARAGLLLPGVPLRPADDVARACALLLLAVPDDALPGLVAGLVETGALRAGQLVAHTSGRHGLAVLEPAVRAGGLPLALHPVLPFTGTEVDLARLTGASLRRHHAGRAAPGRRGAGPRDGRRAGLGARGAAPALARRPRPRRQPPRHARRERGRPAARRRGRRPGRRARAAARRGSRRRAALRRRRAHRPGGPRRRRHRVPPTWPCCPTTSAPPTPRSPASPPTARWRPAGCAPTRPPACWRSSPCHAVSRVITAVADPRGARRGPQGAAGPGRRRHDDGRAARGARGADARRPRAGRQRHRDDLRQPAAVRRRRGPRPLPAHPGGRPRGLRARGRRRRLRADARRRLPDDPLVRVSAGRTGRRASRARPARATSTACSPSCSSCCT